MARTGTGSVANYLKVSSTPITGVPFSISAWFNTSSVAAFQVITSLSCPLTDGTLSYLAIRGSGGGSTLMANYVATDGITSGLAQSSIPVAINAWHHGLAVFTSTNSRTVYLDGGNSGSNSTSISQSAYVEITVGIDENNGGLGGAFTGKIAEVAIWNVALTAPEAAALASGVNLRRVRPSALRAYWPLWGLVLPEPDMSGGLRNLAITGTMAPANHAPVTLWTPRNLIAPLIQTAGPGILNRPPFQYWAA